MNTENSINFENQAIIINGKAIATELREKIAKTVKTHIEKGGKVPGLAVILVGDDSASAVYVRNKHKACEEAGIYSEVIILPEKTTEAELVELIRTLNKNEQINGILVQLPLPKHIDKKVIINEISPDKDVDVFHSVNIGKILTGDYKFAPCTPAGVMYMLKYMGIKTDGKHCVVVGRSDIVGKPMAMLLLHSGATVTICHSRTVNLREICLQADILISAVGHENIITGDMIKAGAVVIDVGINRNKEGKLTGDVNFESAIKKASYITPVPGGVGPMTIAMLLMNTLATSGIKLPD